MQKGEIAFCDALGFICGPSGDDNLIDYPVPLRDGRWLLRPVVNPIIRDLDYECFSEAVLSRFDVSKLDVAIKRENTERFLRFARERRHLKSARES